MNNEHPPRIPSHESVGEKYVFPAEKVTELLEVFSSHGIQVWLDGGWAVDAMAKRQTREHQDLDLLVSIQETERVQKLFIDMGFSIEEDETELPNRLVYIKPAEHLFIDLHFVALHEDGSASFRITNYKGPKESYTYVYNAGGLSAKGMINGVEVSCITLEEQVRSKLERNYFHDDPDRMRPGGVSADLHDLEVIEELLQTKDNEHKT